MLRASSSRVGGPRAAPGLRRAVWALALGLTLTAPRVAAAQRADSVARDIEPVTVLAPRAFSVVGGAAAAIVRPDSARLSVAPTLAELLRSVPQALVRTNSRGEVELSVRGAESRQVQLVLNGLPLSPSWDGRADPSLIPLSGVSELVFTRSTGSLLGGPNAIGGIVELRVAPESARSQSLGIGSDETGALLVAATMGGGVARSPTTRAYWKAGLGWRDRPGLTRARGVPDSDPDAVLRTNTDARQRDAFLGAGWRSTSDAGVDVLVSGYGTVRGVAPELHIANPRRWRYPDQRRVLGQLSGTLPTYRTRAGATRIAGSAGLLNARVRIDAFDDSSYRTVAAREAGDERVLSARTALTQVTPRGHELRVAATVNDIRYVETLDAAPASTYQQRLASLGVEVQRAVGRRTLLTAGVVLDGAQTLQSGGKPGTPDRTRSGWRLGATRALRDGLRAHASASQRGRFPALRELYSGSLARFEPNPDLRPEQLTAFELGVTRDALMDRWEVQLVGFHHALDDAVVRVPFQATNRFMRINRDAVRSTGLELGLAWRALRGPSGRLDLVAQRVQTRDAAGGGAGYEPEHMPSLRATVELRQPIARGVSLAAQGTHIGTQYCVAPGAGNLALRSQQVFGVNAERQWELAAGMFRSLRALLAIDNVGDVAMYEQCGLPRAGRTLRVGLTLH